MIEFLKLHGHRWVLLGIGDVEDALGQVSRLLWVDMHEGQVLAGDWCLCGMEHHLEVCNHLEQLVIVGLLGQTATQSCHS